MRWPHHATPPHASANTCVRWGCLHPLPPSLPSSLSLLRALSLVVRTTLARGREVRAGCGAHLAEDEEFE